MVITRLKFFFKDYIIAIVISLIFLAITLYIFYSNKKSAKERRRIFFDLNIPLAKGDIESRLEDYTMILRGAKGLIESSDTVSRAEWNKYFQRLMINEKYPGFQGLGYTVVVRPHQVKQHTAQIRKSGYPAYKIFPEGDRPIYTSIVYLVPENWRNHRAFGFDMFEEPIRRRAMEIARDTEMPAISGQVTLIQETEEGTQPGFLLYLPVFKSDVDPQTISERREFIKGYVYCPFRAHDFFDAILMEKFKDLNIEVYDESEKNEANLLYQKKVDKQPGKINTPEFSHITTLNLGGHVWKIKLYTSPGFGKSEKGISPSLILLSGTLFSALIFGILFFQAKNRKTNLLKETITDNASAAIFVMDTNGYCTFMNPAAVHMTGYSLKEIRQKPIHEMIHYMHPDRTRYKIESCPIENINKKHEELRGFEDVFIRKDGSFFPVSVSARPIYENGIPIATIKEVVDITDQKKSQETLLLHSKVLESMSEGVIVTDADGHIIYSNKALNNILQLNEDILNGHHVSTLISGSPEARNRMMGKIVNELAKKKNWSGELVNTKKDGSIVFSKVNVNPVESSGKQYWVTVQEDITKERKIREEMEKKNKELIKINADLDTFIYTASHDLKAPISNLEGLMHALMEIASEETSKDPEYKMLADMIYKSISRLKDTIHDLADINKVQRNVAEDISELDICAVIEDVKEDMQSQVIESKAKVILNLEACPSIRFSRANMKSIIYNLLSNAIKFRSPDRQAEVVVKTRRTEQFDVLEVRDNGLGIRKEFQDKIFGMFKRYNIQVEGTGVGLYIVKRIIENSGGRIEVQSREGEGTAFTVYFLR